MKVIGQVPPILLYTLVSLSTLTETIYSSALPQIANQLNTERGIAQLSTTTYFFGFALGIFTLGRISDFYGRRPVILFGISFYVISNILICQSTNINTFIALRFLQAYGASVGSVISQAMTRDSYKGWELSYIFASVAVVMSIMPAIGSAIGGYLIEYFQEWQYIFYFLTALSSTMLIIYIKFLPETNANIGKTEENRFLNLFKIIIKDKILLCNAFIIGIFNGISFSFYIQAPFIFVEKLHMQSSTYGKLILILSLSNLLGGLVAKQMIKKYVDTLKIRMIGFALSIVGCTFLLVGSFITPFLETSLIYYVISIFIPMAIHMVGHSMITPMILRHSLEDYNKVAGSAGSIFGFLYYIIVAMVSFLVSLFHSDNIDNYAYVFTIFLMISIILFCYTVKAKKNIQNNQTLKKQ
ncbi:MAG: Bcr/CflA family efflux MFS transporter [Rickettsiales bacterium]|nr:MAG: Bcr/CflA family efflux MFS transporter [Rickettsiales bacterium]